MVSDLQSLMISHLYVHCIWLSQSFSIISRTKHQAKIIIQEIRQSQSHWRNQAKSVSLRKSDKISLTQEIRQKFSFIQETRPQLRQTEEIRQKSIRHKKSGSAQFYWRNQVKSVKNQSGWRNQAKLSVIEEIRQKSQSRNQAKISLKKSGDDQSDSKNQALACLADGTIQLNPLVSLVSMLIENVFKCLKKENSCKMQNLIHEWTLQKMH